MDHTFIVVVIKMKGVCLYPLSRLIHCSNPTSSILHWVLAVIGSWGSEDPLLDPGAEW